MPHFEPIQHNLKTGDRVGLPDGSLVCAVVDSFPNGVNLTILGQAFYSYAWLAEHTPELMRIVDEDARPA